MDAKQTTSSSWDLWHECHCAVGESLCQAPQRQTHLFLIPCVTFCCLSEFQSFVLFSNSGGCCWLKRWLSHFVFGNQQSGLSVGKERILPVGPTDFFCFGQADVGIVYNDLWDGFDDHHTEVYPVGGLNQPGSTWSLDWIMFYFTISLNLKFKSWTNNILYQQQVKWRL